MSFFFFQAEDGRRYLIVGRVQTCVLVFSSRRRHTRSDRDWSSDLVCRLLLRSEEHTSELQSRSDLVCRLLLEKKKPQDCIASFDPSPFFPSLRSARLFPRTRQLVLCSCAP